jgi:DNA ligase D-like protein (predicted polymerase)
MRGQVQDKAMSKDEVRDGVELTNLDQELFEGADATKRDLVEYLDAVSERMIPGLTNRPLSVIRVLRGQAPFMQKNLPKYTPSWVPKVALWAESSKREVSYALCNDRKTLLWFANQRAVEYHPTLFRVGEWDRPTYLVLDIDPPDTDAFALAVTATQLARQALAGAGLAGAVKTSGAKGLHVFVPIRSATTEEVAAATRALAARAERLDPTVATTAFVREERNGKVFLDSTRAGGATVVTAYSPRIRQGVPVSYPLAWDDLGYLLRVLRNTFVSRHRSATRRPQSVPMPEDLEPIDPRSSSRPAEAMEAREVFEHISALPDEFRDALVAVDVAGLSYAEAAKLLGTKEATITSRLYRARSRVARGMEPDRQGVP